MFDTVFSAVDGAPVDQVTEKIDKVWYVDNRPKNNLGG